MYTDRTPTAFPILTDGLLYALIPLAAGALAAVWSVPAACLFLPPLAFLLFFFRNPARRDEAPPGAIVSPADGMVMSVEETQEELLGGRAVCVTIFLSLFNVHVNRCPIGGTVVYQHYREGAMLPAFKSHASALNERNTVAIEDADGFRAVVRQITGFIARRIVWFVRPGDTVRRSGSFGYIRFGSCTQLLVPYGTEILAVPGQKVRAAVTVLGYRR